MNENFKIPDQSSLFNIKSIYNTFIEKLSESGFENLIINPELDNYVQTSTGKKLAGWEREFPYDPNRLLTNNIYLGPGSKVWQSITERLNFTSVYTLVVDITVKHNPIKIMVKGELESLSMPGHFHPAAYPIDSSDTSFQSKIVAPVYDEYNTAIKQRVAIPFRTSSVDAIYGALQLSLEFFEESTWVDLHNVTLTKGMFGVNIDKHQGIFSDFVRYNEIDGWFEISPDDGENYYRLFTQNPDDISDILDIFLANDVMYTKAESDVMFLRKNIPDTAAELITFDKGLKSNEDITVNEDATLILDGGKMLVNNCQSGSINPEKFFSLEVERGVSPNAAIRYNEAIDKWEFKHDLIWNVFGTGGDGSGGSGSSELEYYAEILENSGFKYGYYDLFDEVDLDYTVLNYSNNLNWKGNESKYIIEDNPGSAGILTTRNVWLPEHAGNAYTFFPHVLTNKENNNGITISYSLIGLGAGEPPPATAATGPQDGVNAVWTPINANEFVSPAFVINELYLKFEFNDDSVEFHSFGVFYGQWDYTACSYTRLREYYTSTTNQGANANILVPNGMSYSKDEKALELYVNRVRQVLDIDYIEVDKHNVQMLMTINTGDIIEFYEKFGYADFSQSNEIALDAHIADTDAHWDAAEMSSFSTHIGDNTIHFPATAYDNHIGDNTIHFPATAYDNHIADTSIHFPSTPYDTHIADTGIHFVSTPYDNHIADTSIHFVSTPYDNHIADNSIHFTATSIENRLDTIELWQTNFSESDSVALSALTTHINDIDDVHDASAITADTSLITNSNATEVQTALEDLDAGITAVAGSSSEIIIDGNFVNPGVSTTQTFTTVLPTGNWKAQVYVEYIVGAGFTVFVNGVEMPNTGGNNQLVVGTYTGSIEVVASNFLMFNYSVIATKIS